MAFATSSDNLGGNLAVLPTASNCEHGKEGKESNRNQNHQSAYSGQYYEREEDERNIDGREA